MLLTGHTGFKGSWLALWLSRLGARVHGYALDPVGSPNLFDAARVADALAADHRADLGNAAALSAALRQAEPEVVLHLAAQSLVRKSYAEPVETWRTNVMGTVQLLEACRESGSVRAIVVVTTDKVYRNEEPGWAFVESDPLGGHDPYSASKAASELAVDSFRASFYAAATAAHIATARAGNVIGGGDWARDRLVPDCLRAFAAGAPVELRHPAAVRPWQHVLEPLSGYLRLVEALLLPGGAEFATAWNFGPDPDDMRDVASVTASLARHWGPQARWRAVIAQEQPHEAAELSLDSSQARTRLQWVPRWPLDKALELTARWHRDWLAGGDARALCSEQIDRYEAAGVA